LPARSRLRRLALKITPRPPRAILVLTRVCGGRLIATMRARIVALVAASCTLALAPAARAQYWSGGMNYNNPWSAQMDMTMTHMIQRAQLESLIKPRNGGKPAPAAQRAAVAAPAPPSHPITATDFKPVGGRMMTETFVDSMGVKVTNRARLVQLLGQGMDGYERIGEIRKHNLAYALTALLGKSLEIYSGKKIPDAKAKQMVKDMNDGLAAKPQFQKLDARQRQSLYESSVLTLVLMVTLHEEGNAQVQGQAKLIATGVLKGFGVPI
jgi:hypothetical protein